MELNDEQLKVKNFPIQNTVVFASAGAGKTRVLIERLVKLIIKDKIELSRIVAMTFTEAAAMELKLRLEEDLEKELAKNPSDDYITNQIAYLPNADISTIHSFFLKIVKKYFYLIDLDEDRLNNVLSDIQKQALIDEAFRYVIENNDVKELNRKLCDDLDNFNILQEVLTFIFDKASDQTDPITWLNKQKEDRKEISKNIYDNYLLTLQEYTSKMSKHLNELVLTNEDGNVASQISILNNLNESINTLINSDLNEEYFNKFNELINEFTGIYALDKTSIKKEVEDNSIFNTTKYKGNSSTDGYITKLTKILISSDNYKEIYNEETNILNQLINLTIKYLDKYEELKRKNNVIDFNDFEHFAYQILTRYPFVVNELKQQYKQIMVDEFQDTNDTQWDIIKTISNNNLFVVGDSKQSIYRFRGANPGIMMSLIDDDSFEKMTLSYNYRSLPELVEFNNVFYDKVMNEYEQGSYIEKDNQKPDPKKKLSNTPHIRLIYSISDVEGSIEDYNEQCYLEVLNYKNQGYELKDIAILTRGNGTSNSIAKYLTDKNIPCYVVSNESYLKEKTFIPLKSIIKLMIDSNDMVSRLSVLTSRFIGLSYDEALKLKDNYYKYDELEKLIKECRLKYKKEGLLSFINYLLKRNDYYLNLYPQDKANYDFFIQTISNLKITSLLNLQYYIEDNEKGSEKPLIYTNSDKDVVPIMTIHKSKGLGFENVILVDYESKSSDSSSDKILFNKKIGFGLRNIKIEKTINDQPYSISYTPITTHAIKHIEKVEEISENLRLLYVATTRPKQNLVLLTKTKERGNSKDDYSPFEKASEKSYEELFEKIKPSLLFGKFDSVGKYIKGERLLRQDYNDALKCKLPSIKNNNKELLRKKFNKEELYSRRASEHDYNEFNFAGGTNYGTLVHNYFEHIVLNNKLTSIDEKEINEWFIDYKEHIPNIKEAILNYINSDLIKDNLNNDFNPEYPYINPDTYVTSIIDLFINTNNKVILIDYKTDNKTEDELISNYTDQLEIYSKELYKRFNKPIDAYLYSTHHKKFIKLNINYA